MKDSNAMQHGNSAVQLTLITAFVLSMAAVFGLQTASAQGLSGVDREAPTSTSMPVLDGDHPIQKQVVEGQVTDAETGEALPGVNVVVEGSEEATGSTVGTQTDQLGRYNIDVPEDLNTLRFTYVGYEPTVIQVGDQTEVDVEMVPTVESLEDVVVVGYGEQERENVTGAVSQITSEELDDRPIQNVTQGLQGKIANVNIDLLSGKPIESPSINIRGATSIGAGGNALVLIDGVEGDPSMLNPNDIESISVLKDASSAAVYGARGAFGVIRIETKDADQDRVTVRYSGKLGASEPTVDQSQYVTDGAVWAQQFVTAFQNRFDTFPQDANKSLPFSEDYYDEIRERSENGEWGETVVGDDGRYRYFHSTDWWSELYNSWTVTSDQSMTVSGGTDLVDLRVSGRMQNNEGLIRHNSDDYQLLNFRAKGNIDAYSWLNVSNNFSIGSRTYFHPENVADGQHAQLDIALEGFPIAPLRNPDGMLSESAAYGLGGYLNGNNFSSYNRNEIRNTTSADLSFPSQNISANTNFTYKRTTDDFERKRTPVPFSRGPEIQDELGANTNSLNIRSDEERYYSFNSNVKYSNVLYNKHSVDANVGVNYEQLVSEGFNIQRGGLLFSDAQNINLATGDDISTGGDYESWIFQGIFARANYIYDDRYLIEFSGRYDGSSKFPEDQRYAFFPSVSAGWRVSEEPFWDVSSELVSRLQIRASYGSMGNGNVNPYRFQETFGINQSSRIIGGEQPQVISDPAVLPEGLTWETVTTWNAGIDLDLVDDKLNITGDIYLRRTTDMFTQALTPPSTFGARPPSGNYADLETRGWEATLSWQDRFQLSDDPFSYSVDFNLSDHRAKITRYNNPEGFLSDFYEGQVVGEIWGYETAGLFGSQEQIDEHADQSRWSPGPGGDYRPGDIMFRDLNGDGVIGPGSNTVDDPGDKKVIGNSTPRYRFGVNLGMDWKNVFISMFFQGVGKRDWMPSTEASFWGQYNRPYNDVPNWHLDEGVTWSEDNPDAFLPRYTGYQTFNYLGVNQSRYVMNAAYVRLKNLQIGYDIPYRWASRVQAQSARLYVSAENVWTWSPLYQTADHLDIENMVAPADRMIGFGARDGYNYPIQRTITLGVNLTF